MASMTDYMEQQLIQESAEIVTESEDELSMAILESYLSMSAAFATIENAFECANICAFCESAEIEAPTEATVIVESFWDSVKNVFETIIDWFRSVIKGFIGLFTSAKLQKLIAKLKQLDGTSQIKAGSDVSFMIVATDYIFLKLEDFKTEIIDEVPTHEVVNGYIENIEKLLKVKTWTADTVANIGGSGDSTFAKIPDPTHLTVSDIITRLEQINKINMPKRGSALLKNLKFDETKYKGNAEDNKDDKLDKVLINNIKKASRLLAKAYDKITAGLAKTSDIAFKGENVDTSSEGYKSDLENAKKAHKEAKKYNEDEDSDNRPKTTSESATETVDGTNVIVENDETVTESEVKTVASTDEYFD